LKTYCVNTEEYTEYDKSKSVLFYWRRGWVKIGSIKVVGMISIWSLEV